MPNDNPGRCLKLFIGSSSEGRHSDLETRRILERGGFSIPIKITHWSQIITPGNFTLDALLEELSKIDAALFISTPDDEIRHRGETKYQPRDNIIFEYGLFMGKMGRKRVSMVLVEENGQFAKLPSDLKGLNLICYHQGRSAEFELRLRGWISSIMGEKSTETVKEETVEDSSKRKTTQEPVPEPPDKAIRDRMVEIPPGTFTMGDDMTGQVEVTISRSFYIDIYPVTQALYKEVMNENPSNFRGENLPVEMVSWFDAINFCNKLSRQSGLDQVYKEVGNRKVEINYEKNGYRLPTEAEWEYACRGNTTEERYGELDDIAWYHANSRNQPQEVGQRTANGFGLYDVLGNVWEWCNDYWSPTYPEGPQKDPKGPEPERGFGRIIRGGSWANFGNIIRSAHRGWKDPSIRENNKGFRLVRSLNR